MQTKGQVISRIRNNNRFLSRDNKLSDRWLLAEISDVTRRLIKQAGNLAKIYKTDELFQYIPCVEMMRVDLSECCFVKSGMYISRSVERLPELETGLYGNLIQRVTTVTGQDLSPTTARDYENIINIKFASNKLYYWVKDGYLYVSQDEIARVSISAYFKDYHPYTGDCYNPYEDQFFCPDWLIDEVMEVLNKELQNLHSFRNDTEVDNIDKSR